MTTKLMLTAVAFVALGGCGPITRGPVAGAPAGARADAAGGLARAALVGSWHLILLEVPGPDGALRRITDAKGSLIYTPTGQVSVQVMYASADAVPSAGPVQYVQGGYEGTFGQYVVDEGTRTVTHRYDGANVRALIGQDLPRRFEISGNRLVLRSTRADEHWSVVWERDGLVARESSALSGSSDARSARAAFPRRRPLEAALAEFEARGEPGVVLSTAARNEAAQRLFARAGIRRTMLEMTRERGD